MNEGLYEITEEEAQKRFSFGLNQVIPLIEKSGLSAQGFPLLWLVSKPGQYGWGGMPSAAMQKDLTEWLSHKDWPKPLLYVLDEPEGHPDRIQAAKKLLERLKALDLPVKFTTANVAIEELGSDYDVWIQLEKRISPEMKAEAAKHNADLWVYNCNMPTENAQLTRALFGLWAYRTGIRGVALWAYYDAQNWYQDADGKMHGRNSGLKSLRSYIRYLSDTLKDLGKDEAKD